MYTSLLNKNFYPSNLIQLDKKGLKWEVRNKRIMSYGIFGSAFTNDNNNEAMILYFVTRIMTLFKQVHLPY